MAISEISQEGSVISALDLDHFNFDLDDNTNLDNMAGFIVRGGRHKAYKQLQLDGAGATTANLFSFTGSIQVLKLYGIVSTVADATSCTGFSFQAYDGTNTVQLTKNDGVLTSMGVKTLIFKNAAATTTVAIKNSDQVRLDETLAALFSQFVLSPKNAVTNYIRVAYTGATGFDMTINFYIEYLPFVEGMDITAV